MIRTKILLPVLLLLLFACSAEKSVIKKARESNTIEGYENYLSKYENGKYADEAKQKIEDIKFSQLRDSLFLSFIKNLKTHTVSNEATILIKPSNKILMGTPVNIEIHHLPPNKVVTLHAYRRKWDGLIYSFASYQSDSNGQIFLNRDEPVRGTFSGADSLGIFWSMDWPSQNDLELPFKVKELDKNTIFLNIEMDNKIIALEELELIDKLPHIVTEKISNDTLVAVFHYPEDKTNLPVLIFLGGGEGGYENINKMSKIISSHGYAVLALAYFKMESLPEHLENIPLEYFFHAIEWVKGKKNVDGSKVIVAGGSRGGELALLLASLRSDIKGVIAIEPSCVLWQGLPHGPLSILFPKPAWTLNGKAFPYLKHKFHLPTMAKFASDARQIELMKFYEGVLDPKSKSEPALIKIEKINGPILLVAGKDGKVWPSYQMCQMMESRLDSLHFQYPVKCLYYDNTGHYVTITPDLSPTITYKYDQTKVGGTNSGNASAQIDSWNQMIGFLKTYFPI